VLTSSAIGTEIDATESVTDAAGSPVDARTSATATETDAAESGGFEDQGICEKCGSLRRNLTAFNGQLLCAECREI